MFDQFRFRRKRQATQSPPRNGVKQPRKVRSTSKCVGINRNITSRISSAKLCELELTLIQEFRDRQPPATVDDFHVFLLSLNSTKQIQQGPYWALIACLLSVQCRDVVALATVREIMELAPGGIVDIQAMPIAVLEDKVRHCNFYKTKAKNIHSCTQQIMDVYNGKIPRSYSGLVSLPGVGPKLAHLMRSVAFGIDETGIVVDTHVHRVARGLKWVFRARTPEHTRKQLERWVPRGSWTSFTLAVVGFGQYIQKNPKSWARDFGKHIVTKYGDMSDQAKAANLMVEKLGGKSKAVDKTNRATP